MNSKIFYFLLSVFFLGSFSSLAKEYHVSVTGSNDNTGSAESPFKSISQACMVARAGDTITVHAGTYREWVNPLFGGTSDLHRIVYRAAEGEEVIIKGSEVVNEWKKVKKGVWKVTLDNAIFGDYNPYKEKIVADWFQNFGRDHHTGEVYLNGRSLYEIDSLEKVLDPLPLKGAQDQEGSLYQWYCQSNGKTTTIWVNFHEFNPTIELVEINVRPTVFSPKKIGVNYITVSGFKMSQAATSWAPPTAEQMGLIGPNWSKGWIIENNSISDSKCSGISLGKERSTGENYSSVYKKKNGHISQLETVFSAIKNGWSKENVGSHIVRNNIIFNCEQTGICGNMGAIFSQLLGNHIYAIYTKRQWGGFEMAGIKLHAPIDVVIKDNCIHNSFKGIWIDWQAQGIRISRNLLYDNSWMDFHLEVSHGPHIIDNNCFLSNLNLWNLSTGTAFINNLFAGQICKGTENERYTPYHYPHSTIIAGIMTTQGGDDRYYNNLFIKTPAPLYDIFKMANRPQREKGTMDFGLGIYDDYPAAMPQLDFFIAELSKVKLPVKSENNLYLNGAVPYKNGKDELTITTPETNIRIEKKAAGLYLYLPMSTDLATIKTRLISSLDLGEAIVPEAIFENPDGTPVVFSSDYFNRKRAPNINKAGPFSNLSLGDNTIKLWPK